MTITINAGREDISSYTQRELKDLFTTIISTDETFEAFNTDLHQCEKNKLIENNTVFVKKNDARTLLILDISKEDAKKLKGKYDKNHFVDLKNGFAKVIKIDTREVDTLVKHGFHTPNKIYTDIIECRNNNTKN